MICKRAVVSLVLGAMVGTPARADLTPIASSLSLTAYADALYGSPQTSTDTQSQGATTHTLSVKVGAESGSYYSLGVGGSASATWTDPSHGEVKFTGLGWGGNEANGTADLSQSTGWTYTFAPGTFDPLVIDYNVTGIGSTSYALVGFFVYLGGGTTLPSNPIAETGINSSGTIDLPIGAGGWYTVRIQPFSNISGGIGSSFASMDGTFDFSDGPKTLAVPELSSMTMAFSISGLAAVALAIRPGIARFARHRTALPGAT